MSRIALIPTCAAALLALSLAAPAQTTPAPGGADSGPQTGLPAPVAPAPVQGAAATEASPPVATPEGGGAAAAPQEPPPAVPGPAPLTTPAEARAPQGAETPPVYVPPAPVPVFDGPAVQPLPSPHDLSPMGMYNQADWVVKGVILSLLAACFLTWTVWLFKTVETFVARGRARRAARILSRAANLAEATRSLVGRRDPGAFMAHAVLEEYRLSDPAIDPAGPDGVKERAASLVGRVEVQALARLRRGMGLLATVGSVAPFVGLFGTVWGIMNAFIGIAETQTTNLAVVAPGIAEALLATAIGLVAAIPAVVIYNHFTRAIASYKQALGDAGAAVQRLLSRDIDFRKIKGV